MIRLQSISTLDQLVERQGVPTGNAIIDALVEWTATNRSNLVKDAADAIGISTRLLGDTVRFFVGATPQDLIIRLRLEQALALLNNPELTSDEVARRCHFASQHYLEQLFKKHYHTTLRAYRTGEARRDFSLTTQQQKEVNTNALKLRNRNNKE